MEYFANRPDGARELAQEIQRERLSAAFADLADSGIIAVERAGLSLSDGWSVVDALKSDAPTAWGAVFYHAQDHDDALAGHGLHLAFGAFDIGPEHEVLSSKVAAVVCQCLRGHGLTCDWTGRVTDRIRVAPFVWGGRHVAAAVKGGV